MCYFSDFKFPSDAPPRDIISANVTKNSCFCFFFFFVHSPNSKIHDGRHSVETPRSRIIVLSYYLRAKKRREKYDRDVERHLSRLPLELHSRLFREFTSPLNCKTLNSTRIALNNNKSGPIWYALYGFPTSYTDSTFGTGLCQPNALSSEFNLASLPVVRQGFFNYFFNLLFLWS